MRPFARAMLCATAAAATLLAATPTPLPKPVETRVDLTKIQPKTLLPKVPLHTEFVVAVNKYGQVTEIVSGKPSKDKTFNLQTEGNALQAYIRTEAGTAVPGTYRLTYDYVPKTARIKRNVELVHTGGVDANAEGAVNKMIDDVKKRGKRPAPAPVKPTHKP